LISSRKIAILGLVSPNTDKGIRDLATWAHVRWPWSALGRLRTSFVGPLDIPVVCGNPLFGDWGFPVETRLDSNSFTCVINSFVSKRQHWILVIFQ
jgi:hypothetical protein